jgi:hypothetical protein
LVATVPFRGRAGQGGEIDVIRLQRARDEESREVRLWPDSEELASSLAAPVWAASERRRTPARARRGDLDGRPSQHGVIVGRRGERRFEESAQ